MQWCTLANLSVVFSTKNLGRDPLKDGAVYRQQRTIEHNRTMGLSSLSHARDADERAPFPEPDPVTRAFKVAIKVLSRSTTVTMSNHHQSTTAYTRKQKQALSLRSLFRSEGQSNDIKLIQHWQEQADTSVADGINRAIDDMLVDMAINGFVLDCEKSEVAAELDYMRRRNQMPADS